MSGPTFLQDVVAGQMIYYYFRNKSFASYRQLSLLRGFLNKILGHIVGCFYLAAQPCWRSRVPTTLQANNHNKVSFFCGINFKKGVINLRF